MAAHERKITSRGMKVVFQVALALALSMKVVLGQEIPIAFITVAEVNRLIDTGAQVTFVDVRGQQEYLARHIKGALSVPLQSLEARYREIPRQGLVVLY